MRCVTFRHHAELSTGFWRAFVAVSLVGLLLNAGIVLMLRSAARLPALLVNGGKLIATTSSLIWNYLSTTPLESSLPIRLVEGDAGRYRQMLILGCGTAVLLLSGTAAMWGGTRLHHRCVRATAPAAGQRRRRIRSGQSGTTFAVSSQPLSLYAATIYPDVTGGDKTYYRGGLTWTLPSL
jgi:hypothetical protein